MKFPTILSFTMAAICGATGGAMLAADHPGIALFDFAAAAWNLVCWRVNSQSLISTNAPDIILYKKTTTNETSL